MTTNEEHLRALRERLTDQELAQAKTAASQRKNTVAAALAVAVMALTATDWFHDKPHGGDDGNAFTLWDLTEATDWSAFATIVVIFAVGIGTLRSAVASDPGRAGHLVNAGLAVLVPVGILIIGGVIDNDLRSASSPWLVAAGAITLCGLHLSQSPVKR